MFHHRMMSLFYRAWAEAQPTVQMDRPEDDQFAKYVGATFGMGLESLKESRCPRRPRQAVHGGASRASVEARGVALQAMLEELFMVPMHVEQYVGEWMPLPLESQLKLGHSPEHGIARCETAVIGDRVWGGQHKFQDRLRARRAWTTSGGFCQGQKSLATTMRDCAQLRRRRARLGASPCCWSGSRFQPWSSAHSDSSAGPAGSATARRVWRQTTSC